MEACEQTQACYQVLRQVQKIGNISGVSTGFWKEVFGASFFSIDDTLEAHYDLADEFQKEANVLKQVVKEFVDTLQTPVH